MSVFSDWPGVGPVPEPEPEGFREEQIEAEKARLAQAAEDQVQASVDAYEHYSGKTVNEGAPSGKKTTPPAKRASHTSD